MNIIHLNDRTSCLMLKGCIGTGSDVNYEPTSAGLVTVAEGAGLSCLLSLPPWPEEYFL